MAHPNARVVVLGGGFGGLCVARQLEKLKAAGAPIDVTLVSRENFVLFTPMLHEVAASDLDITHIVSPLRTLLPRSAIFVGDVDAVDLARRRVRVSHGFDPRAHELAYDQSPCRDHRDPAASLRAARAARLRPRAVYAGGAPPVPWRLEPG